MFTASPSIQIFDYTSTFTQDVEYAFTPSCYTQALLDSDTWLPNAGGGSIITQGGRLDDTPPTVDLQTLSPPSELASYGQLWLTAESSICPWFDGAQKIDSQMASLTRSNAFEARPTKHSRASLIALSESSSSDNEANARSTDAWQPGLQYSETTTVAADDECLLCLDPSSRGVELEKHAKDSKHKRFACRDCNTSFSRHDALTRHRVIHDLRKLYPCTRCDKYSGFGAFRRRDHLHQHLKKKHGVLNPQAEFPRYCTYTCCDFSKSGRFHGFDSRKSYSKHMREVHGKETLNCDVEGCDRKGSKGFARMNDLHRHRKVVHGRS